MTLYGRHVFAASIIAVSMTTQVPAQASEQQTSPSGVQGAQDPATGLGNYPPATKEEKLVSCMALWEPATHMSKTRWKTVCKRVQTDD